MVLYLDVKIDGDLTAAEVAAPTQVITWTAARQARENGVEVVLLAPNTRKDIDKYCTWP